MNIGPYTISTFETGDFALDGGAVLGSIILAKRNIED